MQPWWAEDTFSKTLETLNYSKLLNNWFCWSTAHLCVLLRSSPSAIVCTSFRPSTQKWSPARWTLSLLTWPGENTFYPHRHLNMDFEMINSHFLYKWGLWIHSQLICFYQDQHTQKTRRSRTNENPSSFWPHASDIQRLRRLSWGSRAHASVLNLGLVIYGPYWTLLL